MSSEGSEGSEGEVMLTNVPCEAHFNPSFSIVVTGGGGGGLVSLFPDINKSIITGEFHVFVMEELHPTSVPEGPKNFPLLRSFINRRESTGTHKSELSIQVTSTYQQHTL